MCTRYYMNLCVNLRLTSYLFVPGFVPESVHVSAFLYETKLYQCSYVYTTCTQTCASVRISEYSQGRAKCPFGGSIHDLCVLIVSIGCVSGRCVTPALIPVTGDRVLVQAALVIKCHIWHVSRPICHSAVIFLSR